MAQPRLYLFIGYPGAGKTTVAQAISHKTGAVHLWSDLERQKMFGKDYRGSTETSQLYGYLNELTAQLLSEGKSVIFDTNFNLRADRQKLRQIASDEGAETVVIWVTTPKDLSEHRAVEASEGQPTRLYGNMAEQDFERIASHLQVPDESEKVIKIDGTHLDIDDLFRQLNLA